MCLLSVSGWFNGSWKEIQESELKMQGLVRLRLGAGTIVISAVLNWPKQVTSSNSSRKEASFFARWDNFDKMTWV
jgi:hypothetical protein